jgi:hypothetical protein
MKPGDLVHIFVDNCDRGLGLIVGNDNDTLGVVHDFHVLTGGRVLWFHKGELEPVQPIDGCGMIEK